MSVVVPAFSTNHKAIFLKVLHSAIHRLKHNSHSTRTYEDLFTPVKVSVDVNYNVNCKRSVLRDFGVLDIGYSAENIDW